MFWVSFHFNCIYFRGTSMIFPYLHIICSQFLLEHRSCMLIYILQWLPWPGSWVAAAATRWPSYLLSGTAQKRIVDSCIRDGRRGNEERWLLQLNLAAEKRYGTKLKQRWERWWGQGRLMTLGAKWQGVWIRSRVVSEMTLGFLFWIVIEDGGFSGCSGECRRDARHSEALCCHFHRDVTRPITGALAAARCPHSHHSAHGALNLLL